MTYEEIEKIVKEYDAKLLATDPRFGYSVSLLHEEGTTFHFEYGFAVIFDNWYAIFTEHHRYFIYDMDEVNVIMRGPKIKIEKEDLKTT